MQKTNANTPTKRIPETVTGTPILEAELLKKWLLWLFAAYRTPLTREAEESYTLALADLDRSQLQVGFTEALKRHDSRFPPVPAAIRRYTLCRDCRPTSLADPGCKLCAGTGFIIIPSKKLGDLAAPCACLRRSR